VLLSSAVLLRGRVAAPTAILVAVALVLVGCGGDDTAPTGGNAATTADAAATSGSDAGAGAGVVDSGEAAGIPDLEYTSLGGDEGEWTGMKAVEGRLYAQERVSADVIRVVRFDPGSGMVEASTELTDIEGWNVSPAAVMALEVDRRHLHLLDPDTLELRHTVDFGELGRSGMGGDFPRSDDIWFGLRRRDVDQLQGVLTDMAAVRVDPDTGQVVDRREAPPCGASVVVELDGHLVMGVVCVEQVATLDLATDEVRTYEAFPVGVTVLAWEDTAWLRWKDLGYVGRVRPGDEELETLDLNADGPVLAEVSPLVGGPRGVWLTGLPTDADLDRVLYLVDTDTFTVTARARTPSTVAFLGEVGYVVADGRLATFDPGSVVGGAPREVVRPPTGAPPEVEPVDEVERAVVEAFSTVFDGTVPDEEAWRHLVDDEEMRQVRSQLLELAQQLYPGVAARVTALATDGATASVAYVFIYDDKVAFVPLTGSLTFDGTNWRVTRDTVCRLAAQAAVSEC